MKPSDSDKICMDPALCEQLKRVLDSIEGLLPQRVGRIDWKECHAANWRRHSFAGFLDPVPEIEGIHLDDLLGTARPELARLLSESLARTLCPRSRMSPSPWSPPRFRIKEPGCLV